jgi:hypothetical protein
MLVWIAIVALFFSVAAAKGENREQWSPKQVGMVAVNHVD